MKTRRRVLVLEGRNTTHGGRVNVRELARIILSALVGTVDGGTGRREHRVARVVVALATTRVAFFQPTLSIAGLAVLACTTSATAVIALNGTCRVVLVARDVHHASLS